MKTRREVLGDEHVDGATEDITDLDREFQRWITEMAWGGVWSRPGLDRRTRSLITIGILAALGREDQLEIHLRAAQNTGATPEDITEVILHVGVYAGVPAAHTAVRIAKRAHQETVERDDG